MRAHPVGSVPLTLVPRAVLQGLRDKGNHVLVVEHEASVIRAADHIIEIGPAAGASGGHLVFQGTPVRHRVRGEHGPGAPSPGFWCRRPRS